MCEHCLAHDTSDIDEAYAKLKKAENEFYNYPAVRANLVEVRNKYIADLGPEKGEEYFLDYAAAMLADARLGFMKAAGMLRE